MLKKCKWCKKEKEMRGKQVFCSEKCKQAYKYAKNTGKIFNEVNKKNDVDCKIQKPEWLSEKAAQYWDYLAPIIVKRGHLNDLSKYSFAELCDLHSKLDEINEIINKNVNSLFQKNDKGEIKESVLSELKRKYGKQLLDYCKIFYLTPLSNRGDFGIKEEEKNKNPKDRFFDEN